MPTKKDLELKEFMAYLEKVFPSLLEGLRKRFEEHSRASTPQMKATRKSGKRTG
jgi:hypothetical protein